MICAVNTDFDLNFYSDQIQKLLPPSALQKAEKFHFIEDRKRCLAGEFLKRVLLARYRNTEPSQLTFKTNRFGKPILTDHGKESLQFNLSHSGDWVVLVIDNEPVGIDIELIQTQIPDVEKIVFTEIEITQIYSAEPDRLINRFFQQWTRKESYIKALGLGFSAELEKISILDSTDGIIRIDTNILDKNWIIRDIPFEPEYSLSVCSKKELSDDIKIVKFDSILNSYR